MSERLRYPPHPSSTFAQALARSARAAVRTRKPSWKRSHAYDERRGRSQLERSAIYKKGRGRTHRWRAVQQRVQVRGRCVRECGCCWRALSAALAHIDGEVLPPNVRLRGEVVS